MASCPHLSESVRALRRFLQFDPTDRRLLVRAAMVVTAFRVALWVCPFRVLRRFFANRKPAASSGFPKKKLVWAVEATAKRIPRATCLTQAMALQYLLLRSGYTCTVQIGVTHDEARKFQAHAWVESDGKILIGGREADRYTPLYAWGEKP